MDWQGVGAAARTRANNLTRPTDVLRQEAERTRLQLDFIFARNEFPDARRAPAKGARNPRALAERRPLQEAARGRERPREIRPARRAALRERQHPYRACAQQDPEGSRHPHAPDARLRFELRAGLGLPRASDRMEDRGGELSLQEQAEAEF